MTDTTEGHRRSRDDVLCLGTPPELDLATEEEGRKWRRYVTGVARQWTWKSYGQNVPFDIEWADEADVLVTGKSEEIDEFYNEHLKTCDRCKEGIALAKAYVAQGMTVTLVRVFYVEVW